MQADRFVTEWLNIKPAFGSIQRQVMTIAIVIVYARPFKQKGPPLLRLSDDVVPNEYKDAHNEIIAMRDKAIAHQDFAGEVTGWGENINQLSVDLDSTGVVNFNTTSLSLPDPLATRLSVYLPILIRKMDEQLHPFLKKYFNPLPKPPGSYTMSLAEHPIEWLEPV